eukprot:TRINITY_DN16717_c0_g1_i1.p1 TRINITY_DN16717_c0_g1~~TRINITY_DN16717_c0_g1_i1.p1  ORF type:complete len:254 (-),score=27.66 TRINITY_DN16717_c0_g1_i1:29-703(-)
MGTIYRLGVEKNCLLGAVLSKLDRYRILFYIRDAGWNRELIWLHRINDAHLIHPISKEDDTSMYCLDLIETRQKKVVSVMNEGLSYWWSGPSQSHGLTDLSMYCKNTADDYELAIYIKDKKSFSSVQVSPKVFDPHCPIIKNPEVGGLLEVLDTVRKWYAATITAVETGGFIRISYEGWDSRWDESIHTMKSANRLRKFIAERAVAGNRIPTQDWSKLKIMEFE